MHVLIAITAESYWGPQAECLARTMQGSGCQAQIVTRTLLNSGEAPKTCDLLFCLGTGESLLPFLSAIKASAKVLYLIESVPTLTESDPFTLGKLNTHRAYLKEFDHVFVHTPRSIPMLQTLDVRHVEPLVWPHFPTIFRPMPDVVQDIDILFLGTASPHRQWILYKIGTRFRVITGSDVFHYDTSPLYARAKIVLNIHFTPLRNFECRVIEALGCGAFLLTEELDPSDVFADGRDLAMFDEGNVCDRVGYYLEEHDERAKIARTGRTAVQAYSLQRQTERILEVGRRKL